MTISEFLDMGGYATYVWLAYGSCALILVAGAVLTRRQLKRLERAVADLRAEVRGSDL